MSEKLTNKPFKDNGSWKHSMSIEWFYETDTENEIQEKLKNIKIQEKLNKRG